MTDKTDSKEREADALIRKLRDVLDEARSYIGAPTFSPSMDREAAIAVEEAGSYLAGRASLAANAGSEPVAAYSIDADPHGIRATVADAITGALAFGAQGVNQPPEGHWLVPFWKAAREDKEAVRVKRDLRNELQQQCSTWGTYWRGSDAHGVVLSHPQAVELLQNALGVEVEIEIRGCQTCDYTGVIGDVPCPGCAHPSPPEGMVGGWMPIETAPEGQMVVVGWLDLEDAEHPERHDFDLLEDGCWRQWHERAEHVEVIGGHGVSYTPPYTVWMPVSPIPTSSADSSKGE